jgi:hypothetical protein
MPKPGDHRLRAHNLAASPAFFGGQLLASEREATPRLGAQRDPRVAARRHKDLSENPNLSLQVLDPLCDPLVDRARISGMRNRSVAGSL